MGKRLQEGRSIGGSRGHVDRRFNGQGGGSLYSQRVGNLGNLCCDIMTQSPGSSLACPDRPARGAFSFRILPLMRDGRAARPLPRLSHDPCDQSFRTITLRRAAPVLVSAIASLIWSKDQRREINSSSFSRPCL